MADVHRIYPAKEAREELDQTQARLAVLARSLAQEALRRGSGGGTSDGMDSRVTKLETHMEYVRDDLREIKSDLKSMAARLSDLPTKRDLLSYILASVAIGIAVLAITIGGIVGGLSWIDRSGAAPPSATVTAAQQ